MSLTLSVFLPEIMTKGDDESDDKQNQMNLTESEQAIMDMLKRSNLDGVNRTSNRTAHAFWDTQVSHANNDLPNLLVWVQCGR
jgi:hypothetical protein